MEEKKVDVVVPSEADETIAATAAQSDQPGSQPPAEPDKPLTEKDFRQLRRVYFTVRHDRVNQCGHRFDRMNEPRTNCQYCWFAFFNTHGELAQTADRAFQEQGKAFLIQIRGAKFTKMFLRFMATLAQFQKEQEKNEPAGKIEGSGSVGQNVGQEVRLEGNLSDVRQESGPVASDLPNPIAVV